MHELQAAQQDATLAREHAQTVLDTNQILNGHIADLLKEKEEMMRAGTGLQERLHDIESQQEAREALLRQEADAAHYRIVNDKLHDLRMELDKCRRDKNIFATYSQDEVKDLRAQLNICRGDLDHSRTREKKLRDDLAHCKQQPAAVVECSIIHLESQIETQETTIYRLESNIKVLQTINTKAIADVRDAKRTAAAQVASARSLVEEIEAKFFAEQSECAEARQRGQDPGQDPFIHKSEATAITERVGEQLAEQRRIRKERHHKANSSEWERPGDTRSETQREFDQLPASRAGRGRGRGRTDQEHAQTRRGSIQYMRQSADRQGEDTKADQ